MRTLLIDNHDSYTYNLFQLMAEVYGTPPTVVTNDDSRWAALRVSDFDAVVVSPGPGHPARGRDLGAARAVVADTRVPLLGVCLGHQAIGLLAGAAVSPAPRPRHGHLTRVRHDGTDLFDGVPQDFVAVRYHSLRVVEDGLPAELVPTAWAEDGVLMGLRHRRRPMWGVQFHPESIASEHGARLVENFGRLAEKVAAERGRSLRGGAVVGGRARPRTPARRARPWWGSYRRLDGAVDTATVFPELFGGEDHAFWLDSSRVEPGLSRFSFLGAPSGGDGEVLTYSVDSGLRVRTASGVRSGAESVFSALRSRLVEPVLGLPELPFDLAGGYVGYFGYELKAELGSASRHRPSTPDAVWMSANRLVVVDHEEDVTHLIAVSRGQDDADGREWLSETANRLGTGTGGRVPATGPAAAGTSPPGVRPESGLARTRDEYLADVSWCQRQLRAGESYEICLTTRVTLPAPDDVLATYLAQRVSNPAPYAAFLRVGGVAVLCSSPERFLRVGRDRTVETKPIKGTTARSGDPAVDAARRARLTEDPKVFAENLMIVDLLRNDLGRVCEVGSVHVPRLMAVESYATVHQLVSTVRGTLREEVDLLDCVVACFPGGSMTGAPKPRTMELIDQVETTPRGIYSGALGFLSPNGTADLNIVIRTAVAQDGHLSVGAGGAVVLDSDPGEEFDEMVLKASAPLRGLPPTGEPPAHQPRERTG